VKETADMTTTLDQVPEEFRKYVGMRPPTDDQMHRAHTMAFTLLTECLAAPSTPFRKMAASGLLLCEETEDYIYGQHGSLEEPYRKATRPYLEEWVGTVLREGMNERERAIALNASFPALRERFGKVPVFLYGESDEQTLLKGGGHCSCRGRLLSALCQVAGLQARPVLFWTVPDPKDSEKILGGHTVAEIHVDGQWAYFDPMPGFYCQKPNGSLASIRDIRNDPSLLTDMPQEVQDEMGHTAQPRDGMEPFDYHAWRFFQKVVPTCFAAYDVHAPYLGTWNWATPEFKKKLNHDYELYKRFLRDLASRGELTDEVYAMGVEEFREHFSLTDAQMTVPRNVLDVSVIVGAGKDA